MKLHHWSDAITTFHPGMFGCTQQVVSFMRPKWMDDRDKLLWYTIARGGTVCGIEVEPPDVESSEWGELNRRRVELIQRKVRGTIMATEQDELDALQAAMLDAVDRRFPRPPVNRQLVAELKEKLVKNGESP